MSEGRGSASAQTEVFVLGSRFCLREKSQACIAGASTVPVQWGLSIVKHPASSKQPSSAGRGGIVSEGLSIALTRKVSEKQYFISNNAEHLTARSLGTLLTFY